MGNGILQGLQGGIGGDFLANISSTLTNVKSTFTGFLPSGGIASNLAVETDVIGSIARGESVKYPKISGIMNNMGGRGRGISNVSNYANKPASQSFKASPPGGNISYQPRGSMRTRSFRRDTRGRTRRY